MRRLNIILFLLIPAVVPLLFYALPVRSSTGSTQVRYDVVARGFHIGKAVASVRVSGEEGQKVVHFVNKTDVDTSFFWIRCNIHSSEQATIKGEKLISYSRHEKNKGVNVSVTGRLEGDHFRFEVVEDGGKRSIVIPSSSYEHTTMECPEAVMDFKPDGTKTVRILDTEFMEVVERNYRLIRECSYKVNGKEYHCRIVDFNDPHKSCRRWIGVDHDAIIMFRQDGKSRDGSYSVRATALDLI
jgi:hypothetical protein